ncbi:MAG: hypothetical protein ABSE84_16335 [Isosphaeraceae bacterium]
MRLVSAGEANPYEESATNPAASRPVIIYTKENAPAAPPLTDLPLRENVSQYGITWTFDKPARVGHFINGDWYVVGPVTIKAIDPRPLDGGEIARRELDQMDNERPESARPQRLHAQSARPDEGRLR